MYSYMTSAECETFLDTEKNNFLKQSLSAVLLFKKKKEYILTVEIQLLDKSLCLCVIVQVLHCV